MSHALVNFLNHGLMPFVGRGTDMADILAFWNEGKDAEHMRSMLVTAQAGMGKSRLIEEMLPAVRSGEGLPVHIKLLPESTASLVPLICNALRSDPTARRIVKGGIVQEDAASLLAALRKLARLRPLLILLEDVHLLGELPVDDFAMLVERLADEPLSIICFGRPLDSPAYALLEPSLARRRELAGLSVADVSLLLDGLFGRTTSEPDAERREELARLLQRLAEGSPLALRAILREGVDSGAIRIDEGGIVMPQINLERLAQGGQASALRIGMGMTASLASDELAALGRLSLLGEAFSREAAQMVLTDRGEDDLLERLLYRGLLSPLRTPVSPLAGIDRESVDFPVSAWLPLGFTHTLLHRYCVQSVAGERDFLEMPLASDAPLYSLLSATEYLRSIAENDVSEGDRYGALHRCCNIVHEVILSQSWRRGKELVELLERAILASKDQLRPEEFLDLSIVLLFKKGIVAENEEDYEGWQAPLEEALQRTASPATPALARQRIGAIAKNPHADWGNPEFCRAMLAEIEGLADTWPGLRVSFDYRLFMCLMGVFGTLNNDPDLVNRTEAYYERVIAEHETGRIREMLDTWFLPVLMQKFESREELDVRFRQLRVLEGIPSGRGHATHVADHTIKFLFDTGMVDPLIKRIDESLELFRITNVLQLYVRAAVRRIVARGLIGVKGEELDRDVENLLAENLLPDYTRQLLGSALAETLWLRNDPAWPSVVTERFPESVDLLNPQLRSMLGSSGEGDREETETEDLKADHFNQYMNAPLLRLDDLTARTALIAQYTGEKIEGEKKKSGSAGPSSEEIGTVLEECVAWCRERKLAGPFALLIRLGESVVSEKRLKEWRAATERIERERDAKGKPGVGGRLSITVFGTICVDDGSGEPRKISGGRMKAVLALMVSGAASRQSLSLEEFALIASGDENADPDAVRNNLYVRLHSLRKLLGHDAIISETGEAPRLNEERVRVDLVDISRTLSAVQSCIGKDQLGRGSALLRGVLEDVGEHVLFPGLYDPFFDAARDDFDILLRDTVLTVAESVRREGDLESLVTMLRAALERTPDDEELVELLCDALLRLGRKSQAEQVRRGLNRVMRLDG